MTDDFEEIIGAHPDLEDIEGEVLTTELMVELTHNMVNHIRHAEKLLELASDADHGATIELLVQNIDIQTKMAIANATALDAIRPKQPTVAIVASMEDLVGGTDE